MCSVWKHGDTGHELSLAQIRELAGILKKLNISIVTLGGGEPLLREDIVEIVEIFSKDFDVRLQTNATLANEQQIRALVKAGIKGVSISLDTLNPEKQDYICGPGNTWYSTVEKMILFSKLMPKRGCLLLANTVVSKLNIHELPQIALFVNKLGYSAVFLPVLLAHEAAHDYMFRGHAPKMAFSEEDYPLIDSTYAELTRMKKNGVEITNSISFLAESARFLKKNFHWKCDAGRLYFTVDSDGSFLPCTEIDKTGHLFEEGFVNNFNSPEFKAIVDRKIACCPSCMHPCQVEISKIMHDPMVFMEKAGAILKLNSRARKCMEYAVAVTYADFKA